MFLGGFFPQLSILIVNLIRLKGTKEIMGHISGYICDTISRKKKERERGHEGSDLVNDLIMMVTNLERIVARWWICGHWA